MNERICKSQEFLKDKMRECPLPRNYRVEHSLRVANIGYEIAKEEHFDEEALIIACILHDISYCSEFKEGDWINHGRISAKIALPLLQSMKMPERTILEICYAIAIHVDGKADYKGEITPFALSVRDADRIDRFDAYRIYENLQNIQFSQMSIYDKCNYVNKSLDQLKQKMKEPLGTETATKMWHEKILFQIEFYKHLNSQLENSELKEF